MSHDRHAGHAPTRPAPSVNALAFSATRHCLVGCAIGEILGVLLGGALGVGQGAALVLGVGLAFVFGYAFTFVPLIRGGMALGRATQVTLAADTISIVLMEIVDNAVILMVPGAMDAGLAHPLFWASLIGGLGVAFAVALPVNRWLIARGRGHAIVHGAH